MRIIKLDSSDEVTGVTWYRGCRDGTVTDTRRKDMAVRIKPQDINMVCKHLGILLGSGVVIKSVGVNA